MKARRGVRGADDCRRIGREEKFRGRFIQVSIDRVSFPGGHEVQHEVVHLPSAVCVVPLIEAAAALEVVLVEQFRNSLDGYIHEIPAGILEAGEDPALCARRELEEETGYRAGRLTHLTTLCPLPGVSDHRMHFFLAEDLEPGQQRLEPAECLTVKRLRFELLLESLLCADPQNSVDVHMNDDNGERRVCVADAKTHLALLHVDALLRQRANKPRGEVP